MQVARLNGFLGADRIDLSAFLFLHDDRCFKVQTRIISAAAFVKTLLQSISLFNKRFVSLLPRVQQALETSGPFAPSAVLMVKICYPQIHASFSSSSSYSLCFADPLIAVNLIQY
jgi:hypothetical protein